MDPVIAERDARGIRRGMTLAMLVLWSTAE